MKSDEEMCEIIKHITLNPEEIVDDLTVGDFLQMRQHVTICEDYSEAINKTVNNGRDRNDVNFGGASAN